jgi:hypothetical protein
MVCAGNPDQVIWGEMFSPVIPKLLYTCLEVIISPSATSSLRSSNDGTGGKKS